MGAGAKLIQIATAMVGVVVPGGMILGQQTGGLQIINAITALDEDGQVWQFDANQKGWVPLPVERKEPTT
jgi:hypothetical protein